MKTRSKVVDGQIVEEEVRPDHSDNSIVQAELIESLRNSVAEATVTAEPVMTLQEEFDAQLAEFVKDTSYLEEYKAFVPRQKEVLVKMFRFVPKYNKGKIGQIDLYVESPLNGAIKRNSEVLADKVFPFVKVIKIGTNVEGKDIKLGSLYTIPYNDVVGDDWNPEFMFLMNTMVQQGDKGGLAKVPKDMRQRIPRLEKNWDKYKFSMPNRIESETDEDRLIYLIPEVFLKAEFNI